MKPDGPRSAPQADPAPSGACPPDDLRLLVSRMQRADDDAFGTFYDRVAPLVYGVARNVLRNPALSEEVTQEVLVALWREAPRYDATRGSVTAWVATMAHRRAVDRVRSEQKATDRELRAARREPEGEDVHETVESRLEHQRVRRCLERLTHLQREAIELAYYQGYTYREVARLLGVAQGTVNTRMRDGLIRLRDCLGAAS